MNTIIIIRCNNILSFFEFILYFMLKKGESSWSEHTLKPYTIMTNTRLTIACRMERIYMCLTSSLLLVLSIHPHNVSRHNFNLTALSFASEPSLFRSRVRKELSSQTKYVTMLSMEFDSTAGHMVGIRRGNSVSREWIQKNKNETMYVRGKCQYTQSREHIIALERERERALKHQSI